MWEQAPATPVFHSYGWIGATNPAKNGSLGLDPAGMRV